MTTTTGTSAAKSVVAVATLQLVVFVITTAVWIVNTIFAGNACDPDCDWAGADVAGGVYAVVALAMFLCTGGAVFSAWRTGRALAWVPLVASAGLVGGLLLALALFRAAMS